jgi:hypothetical protein
VLFFSVRATTELVPKPHVTLPALHATIQTLTKLRHNAVLQRPTEQKMRQKFDHPSCATYFQQIAFHHHNFFTFQGFALPSAYFYQKDEQTQHTNFALLAVIIKVLPLATRLIIVRITIIIKICHEFGVNRPVSVSSNSLFKGLPIRLFYLVNNSALFLAPYCSLFLLHVVANLICIFLVFQMVLLGRAVV